MLPSQILFLLISFVSFIEATPKATPSYSYSNATITALGSATTPVCCFVVQDTVTEQWFDITSYSTTHNVVNLTSITTFMTPYPNTMKSRFETNVYTTNATFNFTIPIGINPITTMINDAPGPAQTTIMNVNGTAVITGGMTMPSPGAFYVYNTVKIITAAVVTGADGHESCATPSSFATDGGFDGESDAVETFMVNGNAQAYFGGPDIAGNTLQPTATVTDTYTLTYKYTRSTPPTTSTETDTATITEEGNFYTNSKGEIVTPLQWPSSVVISLVTPFVYAPERGANGETGEGRACLQSGEAVNYGYVPQSLIDFMGSNEVYKSQYPGIESCLPGGPSILQITSCQTVAPTFLNAGGDLTSGTIIIVTPEPTPKPIQTPTTEKPIVKPTTTIDDNPPTTQIPPSQPVTTSNDYPPTTQAPATELIPTSDDYPPATQTPASQLLPTTANNSPAAPPSNAPASNPPDSNPPTSIPPASNPPAFNTPPFSNVPNAITQPIEPTPIGSIINSFFDPTPGDTNPTSIIIASPATIPVSEAPPGVTGPTTTIDGTPFIVIPASTIILPPTNLPAAQPLPSGLGTTTTINGTPVLVIPSATTIPASGLPSGLGTTTTINGTPFVVIQSTIIPLPPPTPTPNALPGPITVISGTTDLVISGPTTIPVNPNFTVQGSTIVEDGTTKVVITGPTSVPVAGALPTGTGSGGTVPFTGAARRIGAGWWWMGIVGLGILGILGVVG